MLEENFQILTRIGQDKQVRNDSTITFLGCETVRKLHFKTKHLRVLINLDHLRGDNSGESTIIVNSKVSLGINITIKHY